MSIDLITLVLLAAMLHAAWNALAKSGGSPLYSIAANNLIGAVVCLCFLWLASFPPLKTWPFYKSIQIACLNRYTQFFTHQRTGLFLHGFISSLEILYRI